MAGEIRLAVRGDAEERDDRTAGGHGLPHVSVFDPHATPTVFVQMLPHEVMLVSKQYCACGNGGELAGHWQQLFPTTFWLPHCPVWPLHF